MNIKEKWVSWEEFNLLFPGLSPTSPTDFGSIGGLTPGSIPFAGATGFLAQDNANLFWDEVNLRLGIGTPTPAADCALHIEFPAQAVVISRLSAKERPWRQWECMDSAWGLAIGIHADDGMIHLNYDTPIGTRDTSMIVFDGPNARVGIREDAPAFPLDIGVATRMQSSLQVDTTLGVTGDTTLTKLIVTGDAQEGLNLTATSSQIHFLGAAGEKGISYRDTGDGQRYAMMFPDGSDVVHLLNRAANGTVEIHANTAVAGAAGDVKVAEFQDDIINFFVGLNITGILTLENTGLHLLDTGGDHDLIIKPGTDLSADRILTITTGDAARTITLSGNPTLADWFDQAVKEASSPSLAGLYIKNSGELRFYDNGNYVGFEAPALDADQIWVLPAVDGGAGEAIVTDGGGNLSFAAVSDEKVAVDNAAVAGYLGAASNDGVLRVSAPLSYADGGNFVTLGVDGTVLVDGDFASKGFCMTDGAGTYSVLSGWEDTGARHELVIGATAGGSLVAGAVYNILIGERAGVNLSTGWYNIMIGYDSGLNCQTGQYNVLIGYKAGENVTVTRVTAVGFMAGGGNAASGSPSWSAYFGTGAGQNTTNSSNSTLIGCYAGDRITTGSANTCVGFYAGHGLTDNLRNVCIGAESGNALDSNDNVHIGYRAGWKQTTGAGNFCVGYMAGAYNVIGEYNVYLGGNAGSGVLNQSNSWNTGVGNSSMFAITIGRENTCLGRNSGFGITSGEDNVAIGFGAGFSLATGTGCVLIGYKAGYNEAGNNKLYISNTDTATPLIYGEFDTPLLKVTGEFDVVGASNLGDGGTTNYASVAADGEITLAGTARVIKQIYLNNAAFTKGATAPTQVILGNLNAWEFDIGDDAVMTSMLPPDWAAGTLITIKVCWYIDEAYAADKEIQWRVDWSAVPHDFSETVDAPTHSGQIDSGDIDIPAVAKRMGISTIGTIAGANLSAGDMLGFTLSRIAVTNDDPTADPAIHHLIIEYTADKLGTAT